MLEKIAVTLVGLLTGLSGRYLYSKKYLFENDLSLSGLLNQKQFTWFYKYLNDDNPYKYRFVSGFLYFCGALCFFSGLFSIIFNRG